MAAEEEGPPRRRARRRSPSPERTIIDDPRRQVYNARTLRERLQALGRDDYATLVAAMERHFSPRGVGRHELVLPLFRLYMRRTPEVFNEDALESPEQFRRAVLSNLHFIEEGFPEFADNWNFLRRTQPDSDDDDDALIADVESDQEDEVLEGRGRARVLRGHRLYR